MPQTKWDDERLVEIRQRGCPGTWCASWPRPAGALAAYLVDVETAELHPALSDGQREHDLAMAHERIAGELSDLQAGELLSRAD